MVQPTATTFESSVINHLTMKFVSAGLQSLRGNAGFPSGHGFSRAKKPVGKGVLTPEVANRSTEAFMRYVIRAS